MWYACVPAFASLMSYWSCMSSMDEVCQSSLNSCLLSPSPSKKVWSSPLCSLSFHVSIFLFTFSYLKIDSDAICFVSHFLSLINPKGGQEKHQSPFTINDPLFSCVHPYLLIKLTHFVPLDSLTHSHSRTLTHAIPRYTNLHAIICNIISCVPTFSYIKYLSYTI